MYSICCCRNEHKCNTAVVPGPVLIAHIITQYRLCSRPTKCTDTEHRRTATTNETSNSNFVHLFDIYRSTDVCCTVYVHATPNYAVVTYREQLVCHVILEKGYSIYSGINITWYTTEWTNTFHLSWKRTAPFLTAVVIVVYMYMVLLLVYNMGCYSSILPVVHATTAVSCNTLYQAAGTLLYVITAQKKKKTADRQISYTSQQQVAEPLPRVHEWQSTSTDTAAYTSLCVVVDNEIMTAVDNTSKYIRVHSILYYFVYIHGLRDSLSPHTQHHTQHHTQNQLHRTLQHQEAFHCCFTQQICTGETCVNTPHIQLQSTEKYYCWPSIIVYVSMYHM